jgi:hypothetical protein
MTASKFNGQPLFFGGPEVEDIHMLVWQEKVGDLHTTNGQMQLRQDADGVLNSWLTDNYDGTLVSSQAPKKETLTPNGGAPNSETLFSDIQEGIKTISHHAQNGEYNESRVQKLTDALARIETALDYYSNDPEAAVETWFPGKPNKTKQYIEALHHYQAWAKKALQAKEDHSKVDKGFALYSYVPVAEPEPEIAPPVVQKPPFKVFMRDAKKDVSDINFDSLDLVRNGNVETGGSLGQQGREYVIQYDDGVEVSYRTWNNTATKKSQQGILKWVAPETMDPLIASESVVARLRETGLSLPEPDDLDMELFYWRHLYGVLKDRADRGSGSRAKVIAKAKELGLDVSNAQWSDPQSEAEAWREAWAELIGPEAVTKWVETQGYLPQLSLNLPNPDAPSGRPYWNRFDADAFLKAMLENGDTGIKKIGWNKSYSGSKISERLQSIALTGGIYTTEERIRLRGGWHIEDGETGASPEADQKRGSANFIFMYPSTTKKHGAELIFHPKVFARTSNYTLPNDGFGDVTARHSSSYFELSKHTGGHEMMLKYDAGLQDSISLMIFPNGQEKARADLIARYKAMGITKINGVPIEEVFVMESDRQTAMAEMMKRFKKEGALL